MKFKALPVTDLTDVTLDFEQLQPFLSNGDVGVDSSGKLAVVKKVLGGQTPLAVDSTGKSLALQLLSTQKLRLAFGTVSCNFTGGGASAVGSAAHGLGADPQGVVGALVGQWTTSTLSLPMFTHDATNIQCQLTSNAGITANLTVFWIALG